MTAKGRLEKFGFQWHQAIEIHCLFKGRLEIKSPGEAIFLGFLEYELLLSAEGEDQCMLPQIICPSLQSGLAARR